MTRINVGIKPAELTGPHLYAERREIKRVANNVRKGKCDLTKIPNTFTLGTGHVRFFYNKMGYLLRRSQEIQAECVRRSGKVLTDYSSAWHGIPKELMNDYRPTKIDRAVVMERLIARDKSYAK